MQYGLMFLVFFPMLMACASFAIGRVNKKARDIFCVAVGLIELAAALTVVFSKAPACSLAHACGFSLNFELDGFRSLYALIIAFMWAMTLLLSPGYFAHYHNRNRYYFFNLMTLGATMGVFLSADLVTTFIFFEVMSFTSYVWVLHDETEDAMRAANTYLAVAVIGGLAALMGIFILGHTFGDLTIATLHERALATQKTGMLYAAGGCILFGFGAKAGMFPLHIWLPKAHPVAPAPASALLSGILTKSGIFGILVLSFDLFFGDIPWAIVIAIPGALTMVIGAILAILSVNLKRTLACSSMSQIGFILVGVAMAGLLGEEGTLAGRGVVLYMMNHSLLKLLLFMAAGAVYMNLHQLDLNDIRGFGRNKPLLHICFLIGGLGLAGIPLTSGYVAKTLIHEAILEAAHHIHEFETALSVLEIFFLASGGTTLAYMTKLYIAVCVEKHPERQEEFDGKKKWLPMTGRIALIAAALVLVVLGLTPYLTMDSIATMATDFLHYGEPHHHVDYFIWANLKGACITLCVGSFLYLVVVRKLLMRENRYLNRLPVWLDLENAVYRPLLLKVLPAICGGIMTLFGENRILAPLSRFFTGFAGWFLHVTGILPDTAVWGSAKLFFPPIRHLDLGTEEDSVTYQAGSILDGIKAKAAGKPRSNEWADMFVRVRVTLEDTTHHMSGGLSFALLMMCAGLVFAFVYLLFMR